MPASLRPHDSSVLWRATYIACMIIVFSYIFFDVLDLDGSDFRSQRYPIKSYAVVPEVVTNIERAYLARWVELWNGQFSSVTTEHVDWISLYPTDEPGTSTLDSARHRGYRVALPRSSIPVPFFSA